MDRIQERTLMRQMEEQEQEPTNIATTAFITKMAKALATEILESEKRKQETDEAMRKYKEATEKPGLLTFWKPTLTEFQQMVESIEIVIGEQALRIHKERTIKAPGRTDGPNNIHVLDYFVKYPKSIDIYQFQALSKVKNAIRTEVNLGRTPGEMTLSIHTTSDPVASDDYYKEQVNTGLKETSFKPIPNASEFVNSFLRNMQTIVDIEIVENESDRFPTKPGFAKDGRPTLIYTVFITPPIFGDQLLRLNTFGIFNSIRLLPQLDTQKILLQFEVFAPRQEPGFTSVKRTRLV